MREPQKVHRIFRILVGKKIVVDRYISGVSVERSRSLHIIIVEIDTVHSVGFDRHTAIQ